MTLGVELVRDCAREPRLRAVGAGIRRKLTRVELAGSSADESELCRLAIGLGHGAWELEGN
ncbi:MAG: hypothetical protein ACRDKJ_11290 [Actinomycetota bacterium]